VSPRFVFAIRCVLALVWLFNGLWKKILCVDPHHLAIVSAACSECRLPPQSTLAVIGACETLLALGILSGLFYRFVSIFQIVIVLTMNIIGMISTGSSLANALGVIITNLPLIICALVVARYGPGDFSIRRHPRVQ
jgi:uncharacterized membrane protein YphA (DoxX/SURF4 family)